MSCFTPYFIAVWLVWLIVVLGVIAVVRLVLPSLLGPLGPQGELVVALGRILIAVVLAVAFVWLIYDLVTCVTTLRLR